MSTRGTYVALAIALVIVLLLPRRVDCGRPGASCHRAGKWRTTCTAYEIEPLAFYALELVLDRNVGFAYARDEECR